MNKLFRFVRVWYKLLTAKLWLRDSFCKQCGVDVRDFHAPDDVWKQVEPHIKYGNVLCYQCFSDVCADVRLPAVWCLTANFADSIRGDDDEICE